MSPLPVLSCADPALLQHLPDPTSPALRELLASTVTSKLRGLEVSQDWKLVDTSECCNHQ